MISLIAAIGKNRELGKKGDLIFHIKDDMKYFREVTTGHKVVMGRKTWESLPGKLKNRENIVASSKEIEDADTTIHDLTKFLQENINTPEEIFVIGGGKVYDLSLPYAKNLYLTEVDADDSDADTFFPEFDRTKYTKEIIKEGKENDLTYVFAKYTKK